MTPDWPIDRELESESKINHWKLSNRLSCRLKIKWGRELSCVLFFVRCGLFWTISDLWNNKISRPSTPSNRLRVKNIEFLIYNLYILLCYRLLEIKSERDGDWKRKIYMRVFFSEFFVMIFKFLAKFEQNRPNLKFGFQGLDMRRDFVKWLKSFEYMAKINFIFQKFVSFQEPTRNF